MPHKRCQVGGCNVPVSYRGYCRTHARQVNGQTHRRNHGVYRSARWLNTRARQLADYPLCVDCGGIATDVDHVVPIEASGDVWDFRNLQSLCKYHHSVKTRREQLA